MDVNEPYDRSNSPDVAKATRRLAAILHADVVGYSRLMGADETGTHARLMTARHLIDGHLVAQGGRVAGTAGDAVLAVFDSVVGAVAAAVAIQKAMAERNAALPEAERLSFRIGLNLGDVIADGGDVFGEGVNVAARIEALADPGGIAVSASVREQVGTRLPVTFTDLGSHALKNIAGPVHIFAVTEGAAAAPRRARRRPLMLVAGLAALALVLAGLGAVYVPPMLGPVETARQPAPETTRPVIAVLPFTERAETPGGSYFADGMTEDVIGALGRFSGLVVLSWSAVAPFRDAAPAPAELGSTLGASYVVSGSIQRAGDRIRVGVQLSASRDGALIWSERYDKQIADVFAVQDAITQQVVAALAVRVTQVEQARAFAAPTANLSAYDAVLRGRDAFRLVERGANVEAQGLFLRAIELDPGYADAHVELGWSYLADLKFGWTQWPRRALDRAGAAADRALELQPLNASAYALRADVLKFEGDMPGAERGIDRALELNPNSAVAHGIHASLMTFIGRPAEAVASAETAFLLDPYPRAEWVMSLLAAYYMEARYQDVVDAAARYADLVETEATHSLILAMAHGMLGNEAEAAEVAARVRRLAPLMQARMIAGLVGGPEHEAVLLEGVRRAGLD